MGNDLRRPVGVSPEEMQASRRGARKIMFKMHNTIRELIGTLDVMDDGIISKSELQDKLQAEQIGDLEVDELTALMTVTDPSKRGYVAAVNFLDKLYDLSDETEADAILRRIY
jgi:Ca2+-binding EF-hand superfamily protein